MIAEIIRARNPESSNDSAIKKATYGTRIIIEMSLLLSCSSSSSCYFPSSFLCSLRCKEAGEAGFSELSEGDRES